MSERFDCVFCKTYHPGIRCDGEHCDIAGPGAPYDVSECRICWVRLKYPPTQIQEGAAPVDAVGSPLPSPYEGRWPVAARWAARWREPGDKGLGDTIERNLARLGGNAVKRLYRAITGKDCGCTERRDRLNAMFPFPQPE